MTQRPSQLSPILQINQISGILNTVAKSFANLLLHDQFRQSQVRLDLYPFELRAIATA